MTQPRSLRALYATLSAPPEAGLVFAAADLPGAAGMRLGRSAAGAALLVALDAVDHDMSSIELKNLSLKPNVTCRTHTSKGTTEGLFTVCMCTTQDARLQGLFLDALQCLVPSRTAAPLDFRSAVEGLIELFSGLQRAPTTSVLGLWGEVFLIYASADPDLLLDSWHQLPGDHYDFARGDERVEVKTTTGRRQHSLSLDQLSPPAGVDVTVASVVTESSTAGMSIVDLLTAAAARCAAADAPARLLTGASKALGADVQHWSEQRYDIARAQDSLRLLPADAIPRPQAEDPRIWDVRFRVDLEGVEVPALPDGGALVQGLQRERR
jgi:hypothetical protein